MIRKSTNQFHKKVRVATLSKAQLRKLFGLDRNQWKQKIVSAEYLQALGMDRDEEKNIKVFNYEQTQKIIQYFKFDKEDLEELLEY